MNTVRILIGSGRFQFMDKEDPLSVEVIDTKTREEWKGFIKNINSTGIYIVELTERIQ